MGTALHYGLRPSGKIHLGNALTLVYGLMNNPNKSGDVIITINEFDGDNITRFVKEYGAPLAYRPQGLEERTENLTAFKEFATAIGELHGYKVAFHPSQGVMNGDNWLQLLQKLFESTDDVCDILGSHKNFPVFPLNPETGVFEKSRYVDGELIYADSNVSVNMDKNFIAEFPVALKLALKHHLLDDQCGAFVIGGNYSRRTISQMKKIGSVFGREKKYLLAPTITNQGRVMSKNRNNVVSLCDILDSFSYDELNSRLKNTANLGKKYVDANDIVM